MQYIKGLYETHLNVQNLDRSIEFYVNTLELEQCYYEAGRRAAFFWIGKPKQFMLGLWEKPAEEVARSHFAFRCESDWVLNESVNFLNSKGIACRNFLSDGTERPMVFAWMPAISIYFDDPDGHSLEFIGLLEGEGRPEAGVISYDEWLALEGKDR